MRGDVRQHFYHHFLFQLDFQLSSPEGDIGTFIPNGEWALLGKNWKQQQSCISTCILMLDNEQFICTFPVKKNWLILAKNA